MKVMMSLELRWNDTEGGGGQNYSERNLSQYHFVHQKSVTDMTAIEMCGRSSYRLQTG